MANGSTVIDGGGEAATNLPFVSQMPAPDARKIRAATEIRHHRQRPGVSSSYRLEGQTTDANEEKVVQQILHPGGNRPPLRSESPSGIFSWREEALTQLGLKLRIEALKLRIRMQILKS